MSNQLVDRARESRLSGAVLKTYLSYIRSRDHSVPVFVFEGDSDLGPYAVWISRIRDDLRYEPLRGTGKDQLLDLRKRLKNDAGGLAARVYFFVDRDFDDLKGQTSGADIYCTDTYSIENELVSERVLTGILQDEFRCIDQTGDRERVIAAFSKVVGDAMNAMQPPNLRLWRAKKLGIRGPGAVDSISKYLVIELNTVTAKFSAADLLELIPLEREPTAEECAELNEEFAGMAPLKRHRGKFFLAFFLRWLEVLAAERKRVGQTLFEQTQDVKFSGQKLSMRTLATYSPVPRSLREFIEGVCVECLAAS